MSDKRYIARELLAQHAKQKKKEKLERRSLLLEEQMKLKKQNKILYLLLIILFVPPLILFPAYPKTHWQYDIYLYITQEMYIVVGTKGPLPFFTILSSIYLTTIMTIFSFYLCFVFIKKHGTKKEFQEFIYSKFFQAEFEASIKYPWLEKPLIKKIIISGMFLLSLLFGVFHFLMDEISFQDGSRRGALIQLSYNFKIGVILWESCLSLLTIFPLFYFGFLVIYLFNFFFRGLGTGKIVISQKRIRKRKKSGKRKT